MTTMQRAKYYAACLAIACVMAAANERYSSLATIAIFILGMVVLHLMYKGDHR